MFTGMVGSTRMCDQHATLMRRALKRHDALIEGLVEHHAGQVLRPRGQGGNRLRVLVRPADALATAAAVECALQSEPWPLETPN